MKEKNTTNKSEAALREERILDFWKENNIFQKSLEKSSPKGEFIFYEGPPTANGKPGIHHLEARAFKDVIPRYKTMQGFHVRRKGGWDTHGLPVELQVEKKLNLNSKIAIEEYGIAKFNQQCKESVWEYLDIWNKFTKRIGFWVDQENPYITYHNTYIESVWNILKEIDNKNLLYKDYKVVPWCPRCGTVLSSHELAQGYKDIKDLSVTVKFKIKGKKDAYILAWTTTPWTLPGNVALAVGEKIDYVKIEKENEFFILAKERLSVIEGEYKIVQEFKGKDLIGLEYEPLYTFLEKNISEKEKSKLEKAYKVYPADFVTTEDGTGIVHTAVMYGQDDFELGTEIGLPKHHLVGLNGRFLTGTGFLDDRFVRDEDVAVDIIKDLAHRGLLFKKERYEHSYPHCWRCKTALIYYARDSWYIKMSDPEIKNKMIEENKNIKWNPAYIRDGRFGEWLKDIKDWAISRERYWGTPLPVWKCESCKKIDVVGSLEELKLKTKKSGNKYFLMRHGEAVSNVKEIIDSKVDKNNKLTKKGIQEVKDSIEKYKNNKFDFIFSSPLLRTKETALIVANSLGFDKNKIIFDERLWEIDTGDFNKKSIEKYHEYIKSISELEYFLTPFPNGKSRLSMYKNMGNFIYELESKYSNKKILIITHGDSVLALDMINKGYTEEKIKSKEKEFKYFKTAEIRKFDFSILPHNENFELDLHRPYIDYISLVCGCGGKLIRTKEVLDVWFDSGAMPFAQDHYPFENKKWIDSKGYPADFITEAIDQTRGWFYTLHAIGALMGRGKAFKNVISLGLLLDASGKKMSKSLGNIVDPFIMIDKYGVDALRFWMYGVNQPGESKNFDEKIVLEFHRQVFALLYNVLAFYELYRNKKLESSFKNLIPRNVLDRWILVRLNELIKITTENLDNYKLFEPTRAIRVFICDLSTWYLRRSRDRIKNDDKEAKRTLYFVLKTLAKIMAPFAPFAAEDVWQKLKNEKDEESIHLVKWPAPYKSFFSKIFGKLKDISIIEKMEVVRNIVTLGLQVRQKAGIPVRQPLASLKLKVESKKLSNEYVNLIKDEINIKKVIFEKKLEIQNSEKSDIEKVVLDTKITPELKEEGNCRELIRAIQAMRKKMKLTPNDMVSLVVETDAMGKKLIQKFKTSLLKIILASKIEFTKNNGEEIKIDNLVFKIEVKR